MTITSPVAPSRRAPGPPGTVGEQPFQIIDLGQIIDRDIGLRRVQRQVILVIGLGRGKIVPRLDLGDDRRRKHPGLAELRDISLGNPGLLSCRRKDRGAVLASHGANAFPPLSCSLSAC
jgi:hypothetical protein